MYDDTIGGHAALCSLYDDDTVGPDPYSNELCCSASGCAPECEVKTSPSLCSSGYVPIISLYSDTNAHVQDASIDTYNTVICCSTTTCGGRLICGVRATSCEIDEEPLASMKYQDNSHVGDKDAYTEWKICCKIVELA